MSKIICLVLCVVAINLQSVYAGSSEDIEMIIKECSKENGVTEAVLHEAMRSEDVKLIEPCFWSCALKKTGFMNEKGEYDVESGMPFVDKIAPELKGTKEYTMIKEMAKECESGKGFLWLKLPDYFVNDKAVSDGDAGCERAALVAACIAEQIKTRRAEILN